MKKIRESNFHVNLSTTTLDLLFVQDGHHSRSPTLLDTTNMTTFANQGLLPRASEPGSPPRPVTWLAELADSDEREKKQPEEDENVNVEVSLVEETKDQQGVHGDQEEVNNEILPTAAEKIDEENLDVPPHHSAEEEEEKQNRAVSFSDNQSNYTSNRSSESHHTTSNNNSHNEGPIPTSQPQRRRPLRISSSSMPSPLVNISHTSSVASKRSPGPCSCLTWSRRRLQVTALGCTSAA